LNGTLENEVLRRKSICMTVKEIEREILHTGFIHHGLQNEC